MLAAKLVLDVEVVEVQVDWARQADLAIAAGDVAGANEQHTLPNLARQLGGDAVGRYFA